LRGDFDATSLHDVSITVTEVDVGPDMRNAKAYVSALGGKITEEALADILNEQAPSFNRAIAKKLTMKFTPRIKFSADHRFDYAEKIESLLNKVKKI
jgi:ribosome-binding factor A